MTQFLLSRPNQLVPLSLFTDRYRAAKSSISEDLQIIKETFEKQGVGLLTTVAGASGGVKYIPFLNKEEARSFAVCWLTELEHSQRILPGGYLYMSDLLSKPDVVNCIGRMFSSHFQRTEPEYVMTVETKGIPLAYATAQYLNVPYIVVRRDHRVTEGSVVSINYVSGSSKRIQTMSLSRRSMREGARVLLIDDFMKAGGTLRGMSDLLEEFQSSVVGACVFVESMATEEKLMSDVVSVLRLNKVDPTSKSIEMQLGNL
jgi:purine operon repressor